MKLNQITLDSVQHDANFAVLNSMKERHQYDAPAEITIDRIEAELSQLRSHSADALLMRCARLAYSSDNLREMAARIAPQLAAMLISADEVD